VLAKVRYAGVNPIDWKIREGDLKQVRPASFPLTLGQDFAGEIAIGGGDLSNFQTGERVFGFGEGPMQSSQRRRSRTSRRPRRKWSSRWLRRCRRGD